MAVVKTVNGLALASMKTRNGLAAASVKTINGLDSAAGPFNGNASLLTNLVDWWPLSEAGGTRVGVHAGLNLTDNNTVTGAAGVGSSLASQFTKANGEFLSRTSEAALQANGSSVAICGWMYFDTLAAPRTLFGKWLANQYEWVMQYEPGGTNRFKLYTAVSLTNADGANPAVANTFGAATTATWYFVYCEYDTSANKAGISINAGALDQVNKSGDILAGTAPFYLGRNQDFGGGGGDHDGRMQRVGFWKRVLTSGERTILYNSGNGLDY